MKTGSRWRFKPSSLAAWLDSRGATPLAATGFESAAGGHSIASMMRDDLVICDLKAQDKRQALQEAADYLARNGYLSRSKEFFDLLMEREELMSTGIAPGVAVPHPRRAVPGMFARSLVLAAISKQGLDFQGVAGVATRVLFVICASDDRSHLRILSRLSRLLRDLALCRRLLSAERPEEVIDAVTRAESALPGGGAPAAGG